MNTSAMHTGNVRVPTLDSRRFVTTRFTTFISFTQLTYISLLISPLARPPGELMVWTITMAIHQLDEAMHERPRDTTVERAIALAGH